MSSKRASWNEFSSSMALAVICLSIGRKFNFSMYIFDSLVMNVDSSTKFYTYPRFLQLIIRAQVGDLSSHSTKYSSYSLTQKVFENMRRVGKGFSGVDTLLFEGMIVAQQDDDIADEGAANVVINDVPVAADEPTIPSPIPTTQPPPPSQDLPSTSQVQPTPPPSPIAQSPSPQQQPQPPQSSHATDISMDLLHTLLETCTTLTRRVKHLEQDKIAQSLEITKLKQRVKKLERRNKLKVSKLKRLKRVGIIQRVDTSKDTIMDDVSKQGRIIANMDAYEDVTLADVSEIAKEVVVDAEIKENADVQGRQAESQAQIYQIDLEHADKVLSMHDDELEPVELKEVVEVVTTAKLMSKVVTAVSATITAADEAYARELEAELNKNINWDEVIEQVQRKEKEYNAMMRYQALKRKPQTEAQARKNKMIYLRIMAGFKIDYFKGMKYDDIRLIIEKYFNFNVAFLEKTKEQMEEEDNKALKRTMPNVKDGVYIEATPLARNVSVVDYEIYTENNKPYFKIIRADGTHQLFLSFLSLLRNFNREDLKVLLELVKEIFASSKPKNFSDDFLLTTLTYMFKKPNVEAQVWKSQRGIYGLVKVKSWKLLESCGVHIITLTTTQMILLVERRYLLTSFTLDQMLNNVRLEVEEESEVTLELLRCVRQQQQEGFRPE
nr:hypothetical protein [Tanacetum cinerariifolium]